MTRLASFVVALATCAGLAACDKPTEDNCRKAIANMQRLMGTDNLRDNEGIESEVRRCKGGSKKKAVECAVSATTLDELRTCEFFKVPANAPGIGPAPAGSAGSAGVAGSAAAGSNGSAGSSDAGSAGSAATGSPAGSAAMGSGSAAAPAAMGSGGAAGSAAAGSAAAGSATAAGSSAK